MQSTTYKAQSRDARTGEFVEVNRTITITEKGSVSIKARDALASSPVQGHLKAVKQIRLASVKR